MCHEVLMPGCDSGFFLLLSTLRKQLAQPFLYFFAVCKIIYNNLHFQYYQFPSWLFGCAVLIIMRFGEFMVFERVCWNIPATWQICTIRHCYGASGGVGCDVFVKSNDSAAAWGTEAALFSGICGDKQQLHQDVSFQASWIGVYTLQNRVPWYK